MLSVHSEQVAVAWSSWVLQLSVGWTQNKSFSVGTFPDVHGFKVHKVASMFAVYSPGHFSHPYVLSTLKT